MAESTHSLVLEQPLLEKIHGDREAQLFCDIGCQIPALGEVMIGDVSVPSRYKLSWGSKLTLIASWHGRLVAHHPDSPPSHSIPADVLMH